MNKTQEAALLSEALENLPKEQEEVVRKAYLEEKTHQEIADETDLPLGTIKSRIRLAMDKLQHSLGGDLS